MIQTKRPSIWCLLHLPPPCKRWLGPLAKGGTSRKTWKPPKISDSITMRSEASSDGIVTSRLFCWPMPSWLAFACTTRVIFLPLLPQNQLTPHRPFSPSPPLKCVICWPCSSFLCPPRHPWYSPGLGGGDSTSIGPAITTPNSVSKRDSPLRLGGQWLGSCVFLLFLVKSVCSCPRISPWMILGWLCRIIS